MKPTRKTGLLTAVSFLLMAALLLATLCGCSEEGNEAGALSDYDSEAFIPVGTPNGDAASNGTVSGETASGGNPSSGQSNGGEAGTVSGEGVQNGGFVVKDKKYDYEGNNLMILNVENQTDKNYKVTIKGQYLDESGAVLKEESKTYEGFAAGWNNNFFFVPGIPFERFAYTLEAEEYTEPCYAQLLTYKWDLEESARGITPEEMSRIAKADAEYKAAIDAGRTDVPVPELQYSPALIFGLGVGFKTADEIKILLDVVILDNKGEVYAVQPQWFNKLVGAKHAEGGDIQWSGKDFYYFPDPDNWEWPEELKGDVTVLFGTVSATLYKKGG